MGSKSCTTGFRLVFWVLLAFAIFAFGFTDSAFALDDGNFGTVCNRVLQYLEGGFGSLVAAAAGIGAIIASATGGFRMAWALVVVSIGAFILREYVDIFFSGLCS